MEKTKPQSATDLGSHFDVSNRDLEATLQDYLSDTPEQAKKKKGVLNLQTVMGVTMLVVAAFAVLQVFLPFDTELSGWMGFLSVTGAALTLITGLGWLSRPPKPKKKARPEIRLSDEVSGTDSYALSKKKRFTKSATDRKLFGVAGGIAEYLGMDPTLVRVLFVVFTFIGSGSPILAYLFLAMFVPNPPRQNRME